MSYEYLQPQTIAALIRLRKQFGTGACLIAGGTDVMVKINGGRLRPEAMISLNRVKNLSNGIKETARGISIGALATLTDIAADKTVRKNFPALQQAADVVGSRQIRNRATMVGNICNASPAADTASPLLVYDAVVNITNGTKSRKVPVASFFTGPGKNVLKADEIVKDVFLPFRKDAAKSAFRRISRREGVDLAIVGAAGQITADGKVRLALTAVGPVPCRVPETEMLLSKKTKDKDVLNNALELLVTEASPISDIRASQEYRFRMIRVLVARVLADCGYPVE